jgi:hypothetical protein
VLVVVVERQPDGKQFGIDIDRKRFRIDERGHRRKQRRGARRGRDGRWNDRQ